MLGKQVLIELTAVLTIMCMLDYNLLCMYLLMEAGMEVKFSVKTTAKSLAKFMINNTYRKLTGIIWIIFSIVVVAVTVYTWSSVDMRSSILMILLASLYTIINPVMLIYKAHRQVKTNESFKEPLNYSLDDKGVTVSQGEDSESTSWDETWKLVKYGDQIILYITTMRAFIWPIEQIGDQYDDVIRLAQDKMGNRCKVKQGK